MQSKIKIGMSKCYWKVRKKVHSHLIPTLWRNVCWIGLLLCSQREFSPHRRTSQSPLKQPSPATHRPAVGRPRRGSWFSCHVAAGFVHWLLLGHPAEISFVASHQSHPGKGELEHPLPRSSPLHSTSRNMRTLIPSKKWYPTLLYEVIACHCDGIHMYYS